MVDVPFRPMNDHFVTILVFFCRFFGKKSGHFRPFLAGGLPQALFFAQIAFLQEKDNFPRLAACRRRFFFAKNDGFGGKMTFLRFIRDVNNPIGSLSQFFGSIRPFPKKKLVLSLFSKNLQKRHFFRNFCFPLTGFFAWEFS